MADPTLLRVVDLAVKARGRTLLESTSFELSEGRRVLLVGTSGSGKSLFCSLLLGFAGPASPQLDVSGSILLDGAELLGAGPEARDARMGAVFQLNALGLFDDLTVDQNLMFGDENEARRKDVAARLRLQHLERPVTECSGGEQMRVAIARTLLRGAGVLVYDEPTTGLDPAARAQVVEAIEENHSRGSLVITHDYESFADWADVVLFIDPSERRIQVLPPGVETFETLRHALESTAEGDEAAPQVRPSFVARCARGWRALATGTVDVLLDAGAFVFLPWAWARLFHALDGPRIRKALRRDVAPSVGAFIGISAVLAAFTGTYFIFERMPQRQYAEPLIQEDIVAALGLIYTRVSVPLMVSVLLAAKLGAAVAAHLGHMSLTRQVDALHLLRVPLRRHLLLPTATGLLVATWAATALAQVLSYATSMVVFLGTHPGYSARYFHEAYGDQLHGADVGWLFAKVSCCALGVALVAYRIGTAPKRYPNEVVKGIHHTLLRALILVLAIHAAFAFMEF